MGSNSVKTLNTAVLSGFMELLPAQQLVFDHMRAVIARCYGLYGFTPLDTPVIERAEVLLAKAGGETEKQIYQFRKGDHELALRFDLTVPLARYVSEHLSDLTFPFRRYQIGKVYRGERPQKGRFREFYQCDIDIIGRNELSLVNDAEILCVIYTTFCELGLENVTIRLNNRKLLNGLFGEIGVDAAAVLRVVDKLEKIGKEAVCLELAGLGVAQEKAQRLVSFLQIEGAPVEKLAQLKATPVQNELFQQGIVELETVLDAIRVLGLPERNYDVDLTIARGLDYYTGTVYETRLDDYPDLGSICSGGRYDNLAGYYTREKLPGVGASIGLTRLFHQLMEAQLIKTGSATKSLVLIIPMTEDNRTSLELASILRSEGIPSQVYSEKGALGKKLKYADRLGVPFSVIIGEDEVKGGYFTLKAMAEKRESKVGLEDLKTHLRKGLSFA